MQFEGKCWYTKTNLQTVRCLCWSPAGNDPVLSVNEALLCRRGGCDLQYLHRQWIWVGLEGATSS